jgi:transposase
MKDRLVLKQGVGLDVSKDTIDACFGQEETGFGQRMISSRVFRVSPKGLEQLHQWLERLAKRPAPMQVAMEATGVYYENAAYFLVSKGHRLSVLLPNRSKAYAKSLGLKSKTDSIDARMLAQLSLERSLPEWKQPGFTMLKVKRLCRERMALLDEKTAVCNRRHAICNSYKPDQSSLQRSKKHTKFLNEQVAAIENAIRKEIQADAQLKQKIDTVCTIPGVGFITAVSIIAEANGFELFKSKAQLVSYAGYDVVQEESGTSLKSKTRISKCGNIHIRKALYFPAIVAVQYCPELKNTFNRVFEKCFIKMKAYTAIQRKLLVLIYAIYKSGQSFQPNFTSSKIPIHNELGRD